MKKIIYFLLLFVFGNANGQLLKERMSIFLMTGPTYSDPRKFIYNDHFLQKGSRQMGYSVGIGPSYFLSKHFSLNTRLLLEKKQFEVDYVLYNNSNILIGESRVNLSKYY